MFSKNSSKETDEFVFAIIFYKYCMGGRVCGVVSVGLSVHLSLLHLAWLVLSTSPARQQSLV